MKKTNQYLGITLLALCFGFISNAQIVFKETFDNIPGPTAGGAGSYSFPNGWFLRNVDNRTPAANVAYVNEAWERREDFATNVIDSVAFSTSWYSPVGGADDWMWTPMIPTLPANCLLKWEARAYDPAYPDGYEVRIMTTAGGPTGGNGVIGNQITNSTVLFSITAEQAGSRASRVVSLAAYAGQNVYIGFRNNSSDKFILIIDNIIVEKVPGPVVTAGAQTNISCNGGSNGSATVAVTGGAPGYTYSWSPSGGTTATASGLAAGTYTCTVTDANGSIGTQSFTITEPTALTTTTGSQNNVSCNGGSNGSASVSVSGGTPGYTYSWAPSGGTTATASGLAAGTYTCTISDANGCTATKTITITQPSVLSVSTVQSNVSCNGGSNGAAGVSVSGGAGGYTYSWAPSGGTGATATGLAAGNYTVTITDANSCTATRNFTITQPAALTATTSQIDALCNIPGQAGVTVSGGAGSYTYLWAPSGGTASIATGLVAGNYSVTVTDANGCTLTKNFTINNASTLSATTLQTNVSCNGGANGTATVIVTGGATPYTYSWSPSGGTTAVATGLAAGTYTCTITDANGCTATATITITQPSAVSGSAVVTNVSCNGANNGTINLTPSGGTPPYTYNWGGVITTEDRTSLVVGTYSVTITDANNCTTTRTFTITQPAALTTTSSQTNISCNGGSNGTASVSVSGGTGAYTYSWAPSGGTAATATGLSAGTYNCTITDANNCTTTRTFTITQPAALTTTSSQTNISCNGGSNGTASVSVSGGTPGYTYSWAPSGGTAAVATGLAAGTYTCTITDANGCTTTKTLTLTQTAAVAVSTVNVPVNGTYTGGDNLNFTVNFNQNVIVNTGGGVPFIPLTLNTGGAVQATYVSGSGTSSLVFIYTISSTNQDADGITIGNSLTLNGGTIENGAGCAALIAINGLPSTTGILVHNPVSQTITFNALPNKTYGDADFDANATASSGLAVSYTSSNTAVATIAGDKIHIVGAGSSIITATQTGNSNYLAATAVSQTLTVNPKAIAVNAEAKNKVYGDADPVFTYAISPALLSGDSFTGELSRVAGEDAGVYAINQGTLALNGNYVLNYTSANLTIGQRSVTVTAEAKSKTYGDADPAFTYTVSPALVSGDVFSGALSRTMGEDVGTYPITQGSLANSNYAISFVNGVLTIDKASQQITWNQTLVAGCDGITNIVLTATASSGLPVNYQSANAAIATINGTQLLITGPGKTMITASQAGNSNYLPAAPVQKELISKLPAYLVVKRWDDVLVFDNSSKEYTAWQWYKNGGLINGATGQYYYESAKLNGDYYAVVKTLAGSTLETCPVTITPGSNFIPIAIFPNPVDPGQSITVKTSYTATQLQGATIVVSDIQGVIIQTIQNVMPQINITMPVVQGFYVIRLKLSNGTTASVNALVKPQ